MINIILGLNGNSIIVDENNIIQDISNYMNISKPWLYNFIFMISDDINKKYNYYEVRNIYNINNNINTFILIINKFTKQQFFDNHDLYDYIIKDNYPKFPIILKYNNKYIESDIFSLHDYFVKKNFILDNSDNFDNYYIRYIIDGTNEELTKFTSRINICNLKLGFDITSNPIILNIKIYNGYEPYSESKLHNQWLEQQNNFYKTLEYTLIKSGYIKIGNIGICNPNKWTKYDTLPCIYTTYEDNYLYISVDYNDHLDLCYDIDDENEMFENYD